MNRDEYELAKSNKHELITADDLSDKSDRTLLFGQSFHEMNRHVYLKDGSIYVYDYRSSCGYDFSNLCSELSSNSKYLPNLYTSPKSCDFEFYTLMVQRGVQFNFIAWGSDVSIIKDDGYYGEIHK